MKEYPNQFYFNNTICRLLFKDDNSILWLERHGRKILVEEWRIKNNFPLQPVNWNEEIWTEFKLRFL